MKILILGYYNRNNLGDDLFEIVFKKVLFTHNLVIKNVDDITEVHGDIDCVVVGGGDVVNDYFMEKIKRITRKFDGPVYGFSIGIPYESAIDDGYLDIFDYIITRNSSDLPKLTTRYGKEYVKYFPDFSMFLEDDLATKRRDNKVKKIGICLANDYYRDNPRFFEQTVEFIRKLSEKYIVCLIAFNTSDSNPNENDNILNEKIKKLVPVNVIAYQSRDINNVLEIFNQLDLCICSRFHSCMLSVITRTPFIPFYSTRKIQEIVNSLGFYKFSYKIDTDIKFRPMYLNDNMLLNLVEYTLNNRDLNIRLINNFVETKYYIQRRDIYKTINFILRYKFVRNSPPYYICDENLTGFVNDTVESVLLVFEKGSLEEIEDKDLLTEVLCFKLIKICKPVYFYGLKEKLSSGNFNSTEELKWVVRDNYKSNNIFSSSYKEHMGGFISKNSNANEHKLNLTYIDQNELRGYHRSGWQYVINKLYDYNSEDHDALFVDMYVDRTFLWKHKVYKTAGILPYTKPWCGFIHHTFNSNYTKNNIYEILKNPEFLISLNNCKCLFVLSEHLKKQLEMELKKLNIYTPVKSLIHPTESVENNFSFKKFKKNGNKKIVQIGAWLRDTYSIFRLDVGVSGFAKYALKGKNMDNYYEDIKKISRRIMYCNCEEKNDYTVCPCRDRICRDQKASPCDNKYVIGLDKHVKFLHDSVTIIDEINNSSYDKLLSENIVFLNLIDASAVNTLLECYIRNTPVIVNKLPAVVELLGDKYPLYYNELSEVKNLLRMCNIRNGYKYLKKQRKDILSIEYFIKSFMSELSNL